MAADAGGMLEARDAAGFVGRRLELDAVDTLLADSEAPPVLFVHGPGGIGKSSLLRAATRRARGYGVAVHRVDGRDPMSAQADLDEALAGTATAAPALVVVDTYERVSALGAQLRAELGPDLGRVRLLIAGRRPPEPAWQEDGWAGVVKTLELRPLTTVDATELLRRHGLTDPAFVEPLVGWAGGSPLALVVAAAAVLSGADLDLARLDADAGLAEALLRRLADQELRGADREILAVAAVADAVDARLLQAVLPGLDGDHAEAWLRGLSFAEAVGTRVTVHDRVRKAVRATLVARDPEHDRELRRRVADHLYGRAALGELRLLRDLAELIDDPVVRWGIAPGAAVTHRADRLRRGDREAISALLRPDEAAWWDSLQRWFLEAGEHIVIVRDAGGAPAGFSIAVTPATAPSWAWTDDEVLARWLADSRSRAPDGDALLMREAVDLGEVRDPGPSPVVGVGNHATVFWSGLRTVRWMYASAGVHRSGGDLAPGEFLEALGYRHTPQLDACPAGRPVRCFVVDWGPGGVVRAVRDMVYRDLGLPAPADAVGSDDAARQLVRDALRSFHDPIALAASPLARGPDADTRVRTLRDRLRAAAGAAFGESDDERLLRAVVERGYLDPSGGHERAIAELHVSRATYFRRLARAADRVASYLLDEV